MGVSDSDLPEAPEGDHEQQPTAAELEAAGQNSMFGDAPETSAQPAAQSAPDPTQEPATKFEISAESAAPAKSDQPYRVLARKYRPQTFAELIGQAPMVRTLANAIERDRLAHAFLMTGVRGVGKTSTARLIAKALNCIGPDGDGGPTIDPCGQCEPCTAIAEGRHIDVIEMDAASHTGVDDVREIIEAVRYAAVSARYKIYIIDEVHMLSRNAFNALLKTLEEPPAHVKFLFATTEVEKLPVTVLSRTQRFDLRRIPSDLLQSHFSEICAKEGAEAEDEALNIIANAAEGSVRDGLSILDQAIAHADMDEGGIVTGARVRDMLGLADKSARRELYTTMLSGDAKALLKAVDDQYALGVEPLALIHSLMELTHAVTVAQVSGGEPDAPTEDERAALKDLAARLDPGQLHRLWQLLLKGHEEVRQAPDQLISAQMALLRVMHAADLPDPGKLSKKLEELASRAPVAAPIGDPAAGKQHRANAAAPTSSVDWAELVQAIDEGGQMRVAQLMRDWVRVIEIAPEKLVYSLADGMAEDPAAEVRDALFKHTGKRWQVERSEAEGAPSLREQREKKAADLAAELERHPLMKAAKSAFPEAEIVTPNDNVARPDNGNGRKWSQ